MPVTILHKGSLMTYQVEGEERETCFGYLMDFKERGIFEPTYGKIDVTTEEAKAHNDALAEAEKDAMIRYGKATLYLNCEMAHKAKTPEGRKTEGKISNFTGSLSFRAYTTYGYHNIARVAYNCWFIGPDGYEWYGRQYGDNTQICRVRRTKTIKNQELANKYKEIIHAASN